MKKLATLALVPVLFLLAGPLAAGDDEIVAKQIANRIGKIEALLASLETSPDDVPARLAVAQACLELSELGCPEALGESVVDLARDQVWAILRSKPEHEVARKLATLLENHVLVFPSDADLGRADEAWREGRYEDAIRLANEVRNRGDGSASLDLLQGVCHLLLWELEDARRYVLASVEADPRGAQALRYLGKCEERAGRFEEATGAYLTALVEDPSYTAAWQDLGWVVRASGRRVRRPRIVKVADLRENPDGSLSIVLGREEKDARTNAWLGYAATRAKWRKTEFAARFGAGVPYQRTYVEEREAWTKAVEIWRAYQARDADLVDPDLDRLAGFERDGLLGAYVYVEAFQPSFASMLDVQGGIERNRVERYLREVVLAGSGR